MTAPTSNQAEEPIMTAYDGNALREEGQAVETTIRKPSFSNATRVAISNHKNKHIILPPSASHATASATLSNLSNCVVDMTLATSTGKPFAALYLKNVVNSLIICGQVDGAAHITGVRDSVLVMGVRQFRMHESADCDLYLHCGSHPIIEDCSGLSFAPLPEAYVCVDSPLNPSFPYPFSLPSFPFSRHSGGVFPNASRRRTQHKPRSRTNTTK